MNYKNPFTIGVDLGQMRDFSAVAAVERVDDKSKPNITDTTYRIRLLRRFPLGTPYRDVARRVSGLLKKEPFCMKASYFCGSVRDLFYYASPIVLDVTGVGAAVGEMFEQCGVRPVRVTITNGAEETHPAPNCWHVPKRDLLTDLLTAFQERKLLLPERLPEGPAFQRELFSVNYRFTESGRQVYEHDCPEEDSHADLVFAVAIAYWFARGPRARTEGPMISVSLSPSVRELERRMR